MVWTAAQATAKTATAKEGTADLARPEPAATAADDRRRAVFARFPNFWFDVGGVPYALDDPYVVTGEVVATVRAAARDAWAVFARVVPIVAALPDDELVSIGIPRNALGVCRYACGPSPTFLGRFDFALTTRGPKLLEFNADTPFFVWESFEVGGAMAVANGLTDPNAGALETFRRAIARELRDVERNATVAVIAYNTWREDWFTGCFTARVASEALEREVRTVPISELRVDARGCTDASGRRIDVLWRYYPIEHFARDPAGDAFFARVQDGSVRVLNPPRALLSQNKATQAVIWGLRESDVFDATTREHVANIFLPTFLDLPHDGARYVRKPVLGREGNGVAIIEGGAVFEASPPSGYESQPVVYQQYVDLPSVAFAHRAESRTFGYAVLSCFVVGGTPCAVGVRVGGRITDTRAFMVPLGVQP